MPRKSYDSNLKAAILKALIDFGGPVTFSNVKKVANITRQLVYYHLESMVKDGIIIAYDNAGGERTYQCKDALYTDGLLNTINAHTLSMLSLIGVDAKSITDKDFDTLFLLMKAKVSTLPMVK